jgi:hypothetical protein
VKRGEESEKIRVKSEKRRRKKVISEKSNFEF